MASKAGPKIVKDDLVLCLDAHDANSYAGEPTTNLVSSSAIDFSVRSTYTGNTFSQVVDSESPSGYACEMSYTGTVNSSSRCKFGAADNIPTSGTGFVSIWAKRSAGSSTTMRPKVYTGYTWYHLEPLDGGSIYFTDEYRPFGIAVTFGTNSGGPNPGFSMTHAGGSTENDKTRWIKPQVTTLSYNAPFAHLSRSESVDFMLHGNVGSGTTFKDSSASNLSFTNQNSVSHGGRSVFGGSAIQFSSSSSQQLTTGSTTAIDFGTDDWTIDFWFNITSGSTARMHAVSCGGGNTNNIDFNFNDGNAFWLYWNSGGTPNITFGSDGDYGDGNWHHLMATRSSGMVRVWVDGVHKGYNDYDSSTAMGQSASIYVGGKNGVYWDGFLDEIRIIKGTAIWSGSGNFTPPTSRHKSGAIADISGRHLGGRFVNGATTGKTHYRDGQVISPVESAYIDFDGTNDYVQCRSIQLSSITAFTVELWINPDVVQDYQNPIDCNYSYNGTTGNIGPRLELRTGTSPNWIISGDTGNNNNYHYLNARSSAPSAGSWGQAVLTYDGSGNTSGLKSYWDGSLVTTGAGTVNSPSAVFVNAMNSVELGHGFHLGSNRHFNGKISSTKIYKKALTASEIKSNFDAHRSRFGI